MLNPVWLVWEVLEVLKLEPGVVLLISEEVDAPEVELTVAESVAVFEEADVMPEVEDRSVDETAEVDCV